MTFLVGHLVAWTVATFALFAATALLVAEWQRPDDRRRLWRLGATLLAVVALALWALRPAWSVNDESTSNGQTTAALWTNAATAFPAPNAVERRYRFALPGANVPGDAGVTFLPDVATLRRRFPEVGRLLILGDGLDPADLPSLAGWRVEFTLGPGAVGKVPSVRSLRCPRVLPLGETLVVEGRVAGLPAGKTAAVSLEGPDGAATEVSTAQADANGEAAFTVRAPSPTAAGKSLWRFHLNGSVGETLGVEVRAPSLPRVLVLESAPQFDVAALRRWYEEAGGVLRARVRLGQDRYRFFAADGSAPAEFNALDAPLLAGFDLVLADGRALASLPAPERETLRAAVAGTGLGVLVLADDAVLPPAAVAPDRAWLFPWQLGPLEDATDSAAASGTEHVARLLWPGLAQPVEISLPTAPFEIVARPGQNGAVRDDQGRALAATAAFGRGTLALTLVRETGRWQRANEPGAFAGYWSFLFAQTARRQEGAARWTLADGEAGPAFVDQPLELDWTGPPPGTIRVTDESGTAPVALAPAMDPDEPGRWRATFWPRAAGWHRVEANGARLDFYVHPAGSWVALAAERRRVATERFAAQSAAGPVSSAPAHPTGPTPVPAGWWFGAFLLGAGFLWTERWLTRA